MYMLYIYYITVTKTRHIDPLNKIEDMGLGRRVKESGIAGYKCIRQEKWGKCQAGFNL